MGWDGKGSGDWRGGLGCGLSAGGFRLGVRSGNALMFLMEVR